MDKSEFKAVVQHTYETLVAKAPEIGDKKWLNDLLERLTDALDDADTPQNKEEWRSLIRAKLKGQ